MKAITSITMKEIRRELSCTEHVTIKAFTTYNDGKSMRDSIMTGMLPIAHLAGSFEGRE